MWSHREHLLRVARRRSASIDDAEDAVHEAMIRAAERTNVDVDRLGPWLTTVTMRLCIDRFRQVTREAEVHTRSALATPGDVTIEEAVCDRAEAKWLADRSTGLPARQRKVLELRAQGLDLARIAQRTGLSYEAVRSLLARARRTLQATLTGTLAVAVWLWRGRPRAAGGGGQTMALASAAATVTIASLALIAPSEAEEARVRPYPSPLAADPRHASRGRETPTPHQPDVSGMSARPGYGLGLPTDTGTRRLTADGLAYPPPSSTLPTPRGADLPALPGLPEAPRPAAPTVPDVAALVEPVTAVRLRGLVELIGTVETNSALAESAGGPFPAGAPLLPKR
ncbi:RNA polymerase sigma factor [Streptomyces sp. 7N604]|uniref:RNA polymerase sigma factor n=1 Tax=Streptomyces sp. 7N604 TaxID=3457415 RepID=UPI003FD5AA84